MSFPCTIRHMCNLHVKETEISQKLSKGIKNWKITYSVILSVISNKTNLILEFSSPLNIVLCTEQRNSVNFSRSIFCSIFLPFLLDTEVQKTNSCSKKTCMYEVLYWFYYGYFFAQVVLVTLWRHKWLNRLSIYSVSLWWCVLQAIFTQKNIWVPKRDSNP